MSRRPFMTELAPGTLNTREERLRVPHYRKPVLMELESEPDMTGRPRADSSASGTSLMESIKSGVSNFFSRFIGRSTTDEKTVVTNQMLKKKRAQVMVSDVRREPVNR